MPPPQAVFCLAWLLSLPFQDAPPWEGRKIGERPTVEGADRESKDHLITLSGLQPGTTLTREKVDKALKELWATLKFEDVKIDVRLDADRALVHIRVREYPVVYRVEFDGIAPDLALRNQLRLQDGEALNPYHLKLDRETIHEQHLLKGYHFSTVEPERRVLPSGEVVLTWKVALGPEVTIDRIEFTGNDSIPEGDLEAAIVSKENGRLFGLIPSGSSPFVHRNLREDVEFIKLHYHREGWLDIRSGNRVFVEDLVFSEDKTTVAIRFHVDEGRRYSIRNVRFEVDPAAPPVFPEDTMRGWLQSKPGQPYNEGLVAKDLERLRERYGEKAYILAEVSPITVLPLEGSELDLVFSIRQNSKITLGRLVFEGNPKTREDVLRREFTRTGFIPGEEFNRRSLDRGIRRITDNGWVEPGKMRWRTQEGDDPDTRDVIFDVTEGPTGNIRFAAGYSSSFGVLGMLEFQQRNFDLADLPTSLADMVGGTGFAGGGQHLRIRLMPAARRQSYTLDFREPYVFGYDFGLGTSLFKVDTFRESYDEARVGGRLVVDKRIETFSLQLGFAAYEIEIENVEPGAPRSLAEIEGRNTVFSLTPAIIYDSRDSRIIPTEGARLELSNEYAGQILAGDWDFNKFKVEVEGHVPLLETEGRLRHVGSALLTFGWVHGARQMEEVPLVERWYAGGRDSIRGFEFRRVGPMENGDPVGGEAYVLGTLEYSFPIFVEFLRGAFFYDIANLAPAIDELPHETWRQTVGVGLRFIIPQLGNIPVKLDFGFPLARDDDDERQTVTFDIGALFGH